MNAPPARVTRATAEAEARTTQVLNTSSRVVLLGRFRQ
jgi:hypothetical protein